MGLESCRLVDLYTETFSCGRMSEAHAEGPQKESRPSEDRPLSSIQSIPEDRMAERCCVLAELMGSPCLWPEVCGRQPLTVEGASVSECLHPAGGVSHPHGDLDSMHAVEPPHEECAVPLHHLALLELSTEIDDGQGGLCNDQEATGRYVQPVDGSRCGERLGAFSGAQVVGERPLHGAVASSADWESRWFFDDCEMCVFVVNGKWALEDSSGRTVACGSGQHIAGTDSPGGRDDFVVQAERTSLRCQICLGSRGKQRSAAGGIAIEPIGRGALRNVVDM